ncbi:MAG TPA: Gfo/Idh/MocA family oxidoreductase [Candidatus Acidoferrales bacterium]|nr:Gfo/Idh/MocA family oxidoreductase [Candidatus Acidoferrales bacterium]
MPGIRLGVIGGGAIAQVIHLPLLKKIEGVEIVALSELSKQRLQILGQQHGIQKLYPAFEDLLKDPEIDAVDICTSTDSHFEVAMKAINAGKNVLVEKPPTVNHEQCEALAKAAEEKGRIVLSAMNNRFRSDFMMLKSYISEKQLGDVFYVNAAWHKREPSTKMYIDSRPQTRRGVMLDLGVVLIDLALWLLNFPKISAINSAFFSHKSKSAAKRDSTLIGKAEDTALVTIRTKDGAMVRLDASWGLQQPNEHFHFEVYGTNGTATLSPLVLHHRVKDELVSLTPVQNSKFENVFKRSYEAELASFVRYLGGVKSDVPTMPQMCQVMKVVDASYVSAKRENAVKV